MTFEKSVFIYNAEFVIGTSKQIVDKLNEINNNKELSLVFTSNLEKVNTLEGEYIFAIIIQTKKTIKGFQR